MTRSKQAKKAGLESLAQGGKMINRTWPTLDRWAARDDLLLDVIIAGCATILSGGRLPDRIKIINKCVKCNYDLWGRYCQCSYTPDEFYELIAKNKSKKSEKKVK